MEHQQIESTEALKKLNELIDEVKVCMLATIQEDNTLSSRPMQTIEVGQNGDIWFFTNEFSEKIRDISKEKVVYLMYAHPGKNTYLHVKGKASIVTDRAKIEELYSPVVKAWFPKGVDDPALALLKVEAEEASYWDTNSGKFVVFFEMVKAIVTGQKFENGGTGSLKIN